MFISVETERRRREEEGGGLRQGEVLTTSPRTAQIFADGAEISTWQGGSKHHTMTKLLCFIDFVAVTKAS